MTTYLVKDGQRIEIDDMWFTPVDGMSVFVDGKEYMIMVKNILHIEGKKADIEKELICSAL
jgi:hypothetical protein